ncbi:hypothetical protein THASP1DRAFT_29927 [Thamnocephalis sphaerospora]|uniref:Large ribosomal subunit protein bL33m n=1 Tax=Thamnocephalis sphaerospora TaxID=78915 RepID=A0A4P9XRY1_9FUNG|nr:hypothetical protein THASP1DRAFT_29927 [Thamnocephalis sphaerospora]|eukprot:RKP08271.1 hypothetical protein THASP1DRAFT_29927 [Thamnocephalis sphaerospora]
MPADRFCTRLSAAAEVQIMNAPALAKKAKARVILVKLLSSAGTGFFYTRSRPRLSPKLSMMKYDPKVRQHVLFNEAKIK